MLTLKRNGEQFEIIHTANDQINHEHYRFSPTRLPPATQHHLRALGIFLDQEHNYSVTALEAKSIVEILDKLKNEIDSNYRYTVHLQTTYLIELIHLITKIHLRQAVERVVQRA